MTRAPDRRRRPRRPRGTTSGRPAGPGRRPVRAGPPGHRPAGRRPAGRRPARGRPAAGWRPQWPGGPGTRRCRRRPGR
ncbi:hypothetical protein DEI83_03860 [Curtobacterium sp. MCBD17_021]|nr:hypothetical protein DEI83_03860 [Curtobacterium sp. MCBD17_021]